MNEIELKKILDEHKLWLNGNGGQQADLSEADLSRANFSGADLRRANFSGADLSEADLSRANFSGADLSEADLSGAGLSEADLSEADLSRANFSGADLRRANFSEADLRRANFSGANLDYSCWPLWCGSKNVKVDLKIAQQIAAHFCALDCKDKKYKAARKAILKFAQKSHRAKDLEIKK